MKSILWIFPVKLSVLEVKELGYKVIGLFPKNIDSKIFQKSCYDAKIVCDEVIEIDDPNLEVISNEVIFQLKQQNFTFIFNSPIDDYIPLSLEISKKLNRLENNELGFKIFQNKYYFRTHLKKYPELKELNPQFRCAKSFLELKNILNSTTNEIIIKPTISNASQNIFFRKIPNDNEKILNFWESHDFSKSLMIEEKIGGKQYSVEIMSILGEHKVLGITEKFEVMPPSFIEVGGLFSVKIQSLVFSQLKEKIFFLLNSINFKSGFSHTEFFITSNGNIKIVESHLRQPGIIPSLFREVYGVSFYHYFIKSLEAKKIIKLPKAKHKIALIDVFEFKPNQILNLDYKLRTDLFKSLVFRINRNDAIKTVTSNWERHGYFILTANNRIHAFAKAKRARKLINNHIGTLHEK